MICRECELEISGILLTMDMRVMDMSEFDVILSMNWLMTHRVVIDCDCRRIIVYTRDGICVIFQGDKHDALPQAVCDAPNLEGHFFFFPTGQVYHDRTPC